MIVNKDMKKWCFVLVVISIDVVVLKCGVSEVKYVVWYGGWKMGDKNMCVVKISEFGKKWIVLYS